MLLKNNFLKILLKKQRWKPDPRKRHFLFIFKARFIFLKEICVSKGGLITDAVHESLCNPILNRTLIWFSTFRSFYRLRSAPQSMKSTPGMYNNRGFYRKR